MQLTPQETARATELIEDVLDGKGDVEKKKEELWKLFGEDGIGLTMATASILTKRNGGKLPEELDNFDDLMEICLPPAGPPDPNTELVDGDDPRVQYNE